MFLRLITALIRLKNEKIPNLSSSSFYVNTAKGQSEEKFDAKFIYEKMVDIYHKSLTVNTGEYFSQFGYDLVSDKYLRNGYIVHRAVPDAGVNHFNLSRNEVINGWGNKELSFTTHTLSNNLYTTVESRYSTRSRKEYNEFLNYILSIGYKLATDSSQTEIQTYQMNKLQVVFQKLKGDDSKPYKIIYSVNTN